MNKKLAIVTLGCSKNQVDSEVMSGLLNSRYELTEQPEEAHVIVVNTCTFIQAAKEESIDAILEVAQLKQTGSCEVLVATGCLAQRYGEELQREIPELDAVVGTGEFARIPEIVEEIRKTVPDKALVYVGEPNFIYNESMPRRLSTPKATAYVKIADGCDNFCTYCIIPQVRGHYRSRKEESILKEVEGLVEQGVKEIMLIAQDTTRYGMDLYQELRLPALVKKLAKINGVEWIRLLYCYPDLFTDELIETMAAEPKVCRYVDLPLQHGDNGILQAMNRRGTAEEAEKLIARLRKAMPDITIRTTMITGFPGETEENFANLLQYVERVQFDKLGVFAYSEEENTPAAARKDQVPISIREQRREILMTTQQDIAAQRQQSWVQKQRRVLLEEKLPDGRWMGRTEGDAPEIDGQVYVQGGPEIFQAGDIIDVKILQADSYDLIGEVVK